MKNRRLPPPTSPLPLSHRMAMAIAPPRPGIEETARSIGNRLRRYSATSLVDLALKTLSNFRGSKVDELRSAPWLTLLLVKWALQDKMVNLRIGPSIPHAEFDRMRQQLWDAPHSKDTPPNVWLMMRTILHAQVEFQRKESWGFLRWPALYARLQKGHRSRQQFREAMGMEPDTYIDLTYALYAVVANGDAPFTVAWFDSLRPTYGEDVDRIIELFSRDLMRLREELQADAAHRIRGRQELFEFPYLKRFPFIRMRDGRFHCWHPLVFSRGAEEAVHLQLAEKFGADYSHSFSKVFEAYVIELVLDADATVLTETDYKAIAGGHAPAVDAIVQCEGCNVFVEAKMALFADDVLLQDNELSAYNKTKQVRDAIRQAWRVGKLLREHDSFDERFQKEEDFLLVVTSRELILGGGEALLRLYPPSMFSYPDDVSEKRLPLLNVFILSIEEFERLMGCVISREIELGTLLREAAAANQHGSTARMFFSDFLKAHTKRWTQPKALEQARYESERRIFGSVGE